MLAFQFISHSWKANIAVLKYYKTQPIELSQVLRAVKGDIEVWETSLLEIPSLFLLLLPPDGLTAMEWQPFFSLHFWMTAELL